MLWSRAWHPICGPKASPLYQALRSWTSITCMDWYLGAQWQMCFSNIQCSCPARSLCTYWTPSSRSTVFCDLCSPDSFQSFSSLLNHQKVFPFPREPCYNIHTYNIHTCVYTHTSMYTHTHTWIARLLVRMTHPQVAVFFLYVAKMSRS